MTYGARFTHGTRSFDLNSAEFTLFRDFIFPAADEALNIGTGTSGNRSGGKVVSKRPQDRWWAWSVRILGTSKAQTHMAARRLSAWLNQALEDKSSKVYFEYRVNADIPEPIWGQHGAAYRWEVKAAIMDMDGSYYVAEIPSSALILPISLLVAPYALGKKQLMAQAKGGVIENSIGTADGSIRGTIIASATTNKMTNPVFGHGTPLNDWTAGADLVAVANTDANYVLWGTNSARITRVSGGANRVFSQSIAAGNTNAHTLQAYVKKIDGSAVTSSDLTLFYNASLITTYTAMGNGWYRLTAAVTGIAAATVTGVALGAINTPVFVAGVQLAEQADISPMTHGDMLGCSWSGTAHASTSVRVVGYTRIPTAGILSANQGTICVAVRHMTPAAGHSYDRTLFSDGKLTAFLENSTAKYWFLDGTNTISGGAAQTFAAGAIHVLHFVWGKDGLKTYLNGAAYDSGATFTAWTLGDYLYVGSNTTPLGHFNGTFLDFTIWDKPLTAAEIAADYDDISDHVRGGDGYGQRLGAIPWLWTKDGDNQVDNCTQGTTYNHYAIAGGIPGTTEAETEITGVPDGAAPTSLYTINLSNLATISFVDPTKATVSTLYKDLSGTADADASGGSALTVSVTTSGTAVNGATIWGIDNYPNGVPELANSDYCIIARIKDSTTGYLRIAPYVLSDVTYILGNYSPALATTTAYKLYRSSFINAGISIDEIIKSYGLPSILTQPNIYRNTGTANMYVDYICAMPRPFCSLTLAMAESVFAIKSGKPIYRISKYSGDPIDFSPNKYNLLQALMGDQTYEPGIAYTLTYTIYVTPRYMIL